MKSWNKSAVPAGNSARYAGGWYDISENMAEADSLGDESQRALRARASQAGLRGSGSLWVDRSRYWFKTRAASCATIACAARVGWMPSQNRYSSAA